MPKDSIPSGNSKKEFAYFYAFRGDGDMFLMAVGINLPRIRKKDIEQTARGPISIIPRDDETFTALVAERDKARLEYAEEYQQSLEDADQARKELIQAGITPAQPSEQSPISGVAALLDKTPFDTMPPEQRLVVARQLANDSRDMLRGIRETQILDPNDVPLRKLDPQKTKLYVMGHGKAGTAFLTSSPSAGIFSFKELAQQLRVSCLNWKFESLRLVSCDSADTDLRTAFEPDPPPSKGFWRQRRAPAQILADKLSRVGFANPQVTGYQGRGMMLPSGSTGVQFISGSSPRVEARRSTVATVFTPGKGKRRLLPRSCV
jgi:hypothetical protein